MLTKSRSTAVIIIAVIIFAALGCAACALAGWWAYRISAGEPPGVGEKAERGYQATQPIIEALEAYKAAEGKYPEALATLAPTYLANIPSEVNDFPIDYRLTETSYSLEFSYTGPGMNHCAYTPESGWDCSGYY